MGPHAKTERDLQYSQTFVHLELRHSRCEETQPALVQHSRDAPVQVTGSHVVAPAPRQSASAEVPPGQLPAPVTWGGGAEQLATG